MSTSNGYGKLAQFMAKNDYTILRQFRSIANRDLLYLQAELAVLEQEHASLVNRDGSLMGEQQLYDGNWEILSSSPTRPSGDSCVAQYAEMANKPRARNRDVSLLRSWIQRPDLGGGLEVSGCDLHPMETSVYEPIHSDDLISLGYRLGENDFFTRLLLGPVFHKLERRLRRFKKPVPTDPEKQTTESNLFRYPDTIITTVVDIMGTILASMTPMLSIIVLCFVKNLASRLAVVCACSLFFSASLAVVTKAKRVEVFACTAA
ncbi:hypothetical protein BJ875DRAFT_443610 [Amylocarpus encephaloides]|uniref:DUF6594 domain-containing protein n=1 Tax=Amylocarpus encephaloides TaxID=45428 RepID=A0A9P7YEF4_9HELO|nr:hypothetical protein BJ875DRAFT_443610 [Amylocarpus encephaloides]